MGLWAACPESGLFSVLVLGEVMPRLHEEAKGKKTLQSMRWWETAVVPSPYAAKKHKESLGSYVGWIVLVRSRVDLSEMNTFSRPHVPTSPVHPPLPSSANCHHHSFVCGWRGERRESRHREVKLHQLPRLNFFFDGILCCYWVWDEN